MSQVGTVNVQAQKLYTGFNGQYIRGSWRPGQSSNTYQDIDPYTSKTITELILGNQDDLDEAYRVAAQEQNAWAEKLPAERAAVLYKAAAIMEARHDEILDWLIREAGSTRIKAQLEWAMVHDSLPVYANFAYRVEGRLNPINEPGKESRVHRHPLGVIGVISPWNFPLHLSHRSIGPALALGNAVVLKPSLDTPITGGLLIAKIYEEAGLPAGVLNVVVGESKEIGDAFVQHAVPRLISFTGSTPVGHHIGELAEKAPRIKHVALELGGNCPLVVLDDADLDVAVPAAVVGRFLHQGQICISTNRIIVDASIYDAFVDRFTAHVGSLKCGNPNDPDTVIGPIINDRQLSRLLDLIKKGRAEGARQVFGGDPQGRVLPPHVFIDATNSMTIAQEELFGPVVSIIKVDSEDEALYVANDTEYGLSSAVCTRDEGRGWRFAQRIEAGMTHVNDMTFDDQPNCPFGGEKNSGLGRFGGDWVVNELTSDHWVTLQHTKQTYPF